MGNDPRWGSELVDEEDTGEVPRQVLRDVLARIRNEDALRQRAMEALRQSRTNEQPFELDASIDGPPPEPLRRRLWSPATFFAGLGLFASVPLALFWWLLG